MKSTSLKMIKVTKEELFKLALRINDMEQKQEENKQLLLQNYKKDFQNLIIHLDKVPGPLMYDRYLLFTAKKENYSRDECLSIEKELLKELRKKIVDLGNAHLN